MKEPANDHHTPARQTRANHADPRDRPGVLVAEDTDFIATIIVALIEELGWRALGPVASLPAALDAAASAIAVAAVVDVNLGGDLAWEVARILLRRGVPVLLTTGYGDDADRPADLAAVPVLGKPFSLDALEAWLRGAVAPG